MVFICKNCTVPVGLLMMAGILYSLVLAVLATDGWCLSERMLVSMLSLKRLQRYSVQGLDLGHTVLT